MEFLVRLQTGPIACQRRNIPENEREGQPDSRARLTDRIRHFPGSSELRVGLGTYQVGAASQLAHGARAHRRSRERESRVVPVPS